MLLLAVIAQALAVIGKQRNRRAIVDVQRAQPIEQPSDDLVHIRDLAVVRLVG